MIWPYKERYDMTWKECEKEAESREKSNKKNRN